MDVGPRSSGAIGPSTVWIGMTSFSRSVAGVGSNLGDLGSHPAAATEASSACYTWSQSRTLCIHVATLPSMTTAPEAPAVVGNAVLIVVDIQGGSVPSDESRSEIPTMGGRAERAGRVERLIDECRAHGVPVVFIQEVHKPSLVDIGRELDGAEGPHCVEGEPTTALAPGLVPGP